MKRGSTLVTVCTSIIAAAMTTTAIADPCGMVPPVHAGADIPIAHVCEQKTSVFFKGGGETVISMFYRQFGSMNGFLRGIHRSDDRCFSMDRYEGIDCDSE